MPTDGYGDITPQRLQDMQVDAIERILAERIVEDTGHGTTTGYRRGCRCDLCRDAKAEYDRQERMARRAAERALPAYRPRPKQWRTWDKPGPVVIRKVGD